MKEFIVSLEGRELKLVYTSESAKALKRRFGKPLKRLVFDDVLGCDEHGNLQALYDPEAQHAFVSAGLVGAGHKTWNETKVSAAVDKLVATGGNVLDLVIPAVKAAFYQGIVLGRSYDFDIEAGAGEGGDAEQAARDGEGNAPGPVKAAE